MAESTDLTAERANMLAVLEQCRAELREVAAQGESKLRATQVTDKWDGLDMLRHILVWNEHAQVSLNNWQAPPNLIQFGQDFNGYNEAAVAAHHSLDLDGLIARLTTGYDRYAVMLAHDTDEFLGEAGHAPWGEPTNRLGVLGVIHHDLEHYEHLRTALGS